jgi:signal transduction histidine kinase/ActR/RegA family two-component response regulator
MTQTARRETDRDRDRDRDRERELAAARAAADRANRRLGFLTQATQALTSHAVCDDALQAFARATVPELADCCAIDLGALGGEPGELRRVAEVAADDAERAHIALPPRKRGSRNEDPIRTVMRTGKTIWIQDLGEEDPLAGGGAPPSRQLSLRAVAPRAIIHAPIAARGRTLGVMTMVYGRSRRRYDESDVGVVEHLARQAAGVVENAELAAAVESARRESEEARAAGAAAIRFKDQFLSTVSHELRAPMAAVLLWENVLGSAKEESMRTRARAAIRQSALAQSKLIEDLLDLSRCTAGTLRIERAPVPIAAFVADAVDAALPLAEERGIQVDCQCDLALGSVTGDAARLRQIVGNLLSNAIKFSEPGGRVTVSAAHVASRVEIVVVDRGKGISPALLPEIWTPFQQAGRQAGDVQTGLGCGLALARHLTALHDGTVRAESEGQGRGAKMTVSLPLGAAGVAGVVVPVEAEAPPPPPLGPAPAPARERVKDAAARRRRTPLRQRAARQLKGLRILVVDDEPRVREAIALVLRDAGSKVNLAASSAEAMTTLRRGRWDVVVSDIGMPGEDGYSFVRRLRKLPANEGGSVPAVALTGYTRAQDQARALEAGFDLHLAKPVEADDLIAAVATVAGRPVVPAA